MQRVDGRGTFLLLQTTGPPANQLYGEGKNGKSWFRAVPRRHSQAGSRGRKPIEISATKVSISAAIGRLAGDGKGALIGTAVGAGAGTAAAGATGKEEAVIHAETAITFTTTANASAK